MTSTDGRPPKPRRILDRSDAIVRREEALSRALVVTVLSDMVEGTAALVRPAIALRFEIEEARMTLFPYGPTSFLLILPDDELTVRVYNDGQPFITPSLRLHIMRWTRLLHSTAGNLTEAVEIKVQGIPSHVWDLSTVEVLLDEYKHY